MSAWASFVGLGLTGAGILLGFYWPTVGARWAGEVADREERQLRIRYGVGVGCVLIGTGLQMYAAWPL